MAKEFFGVSDRHVAGTMEETKEELMSACPGLRAIAKMPRWQRALYALLHGWLPNILTGVMAWGVLNLAGASWTTMLALAVMFFAGMFVRQIVAFIHAAIDTAFGVNPADEEAAR